MYKQTEFGVEFSGIKFDGQKIMGLVKSGALSSNIDINNALIWNVPSKWSLEEAATVPYSFFMVSFVL